MYIVCVFFYTWRWILAYFRIQKCPFEITKSDNLKVSYQNHKINKRWSRVGLRAINTSILNKRVHWKGWFTYQELELYTRLLRREIRDSEDYTPALWMSPYFSWGPLLQDWFFQTCRARGLFWPTTQLALPSLSMLVQKPHYNHNCSISWPLMEYLKGNGLVSYHSIKDFCNHPPD